MSKETIHKWILFISSYIPLYLVLIIKDIIYRIENHKNIEWKYFYKINSINDIMIVILIIISTISFCYLKCMIKGIKGQVYLLID